MELSAPSTKDQAQLLEWSYGDRVAVVPNFPHIRFQNHVEQYPDKAALVFDGGVLTYAQLNRRANQLAHQLIGLGVGRDIAVAVLLGRSPELVTAYLGVLKAGGAVFPLACKAPTAQLQTLLDTVSPKVLITDSPQRTRFNLPGCSILCLDALAGEINAQPDSPPDLVNSPHHLAYLLATSGSTGIPKIVKWTFGFRIASSSESPDDRHLLKSCSGTTFTVGEIMRPLVTGGTLFIAPTGLEHDPYQLAEFIGRHVITRLLMTPSQLREFLDVEDLSICQCLQQVQCSGELVTSSLRRKFLDRMKSQLLISYGCTEVPSATTCICSPCDETDRIDVGRPAPEKQVFVLDTHRRLSPVGIPGEVYLGGQMSSGYLNDPSGTSERFIAHPFDTHPDSRLFRTGDRGRWLPDGSLEVLGRNDRQVKIRGFRVELGEIESHLEQHQAVAQCVAVMQEVRSDDQRLVAYWVSHTNISATGSELRQYLRYRLAEQSVPSNFVRLTSLPLTPNGKLDRQALPAIDPERPDLDVDFAPPRNPLETQLAAIWAEVLGLDRIGVHDNFFALGGHSLLAVRLFARIEKSFGVRLPLAVLFQHGTIGHLAELLVESRPDSDIATVLTLQPEGNGRPLFMMPMIGGGAMVSRALFECLDGRFPIFGLQLSLAPQNLDQFRDFRTTAGCLVKALRKFQPHGPYALAGFSYGGMMAFEVACQLNEMGEKVDLLAVIDAGPGRRGLDPQWNDRWTRMPRIAVNMPSWLREELRTFSASKFTERSVRKLRQFFRFFASKGLAKKELDDVFDLGRIPIQNRELTQALYNGFRDYIPRPYSGKLTLIRAQTGPLLRGRSQDLGWTRFASNLDIRNVSGNHETIWHPPHVTELARQLSMLMGSIE